MRFKKPAYGFQNMEDLDSDLIAVTKKLEELVRQNMLDADNNDREYDI